ncbi:forkhead-associated domain-containing protein 1 isoform X2 [Alligator mississippiensis]|uniref:forkhead-associated domain-containing protein 1 isoform X2 n=1 Tax=Alligator mississippiensis TaxID=8496 RepID=UPI0028777A83|nr:forkhead-associated domain-containing protein 1 isoform X2 [Alligator mississippiensis]
MRAFLKSPDGVFMLKSKGTTIGRHENSDIILKSAGVEERHAAIEFSDSETSFVLRDFNSLHGTFVNDCQIQNAAVRVGPGDILRFGSGGTSYELAIENAPQMSYPSLKRRTAWSGQLQFVAETKLYTPSTSPSQLPFLQSQQSAGVHNTCVHGANGTAPCPPVRKRPVSARGRMITSSCSPDAFNRPPAARQVLTGVQGNSHAGASGVPFSRINTVDLLLQEKDEAILKLENEISRLVGLESESKHKDTVIANLQDEIAVMTKKMAQEAARNDVEFTQKLLSFEQDIGAKTEEIKALKEQISNLQKGSSQVLCHSLLEKDREIVNLKKEGEKLRKEQTLTTGLVTSLQKDISVKQQKILQLRLDADKLKKENREKDNQLALVSAKRIGELEFQVKGLQGEIQKCCTEEEVLKNRLAEKAKAEEELKEECERKSLQLKEMGRRERLVKGDLEQAKAQLKSFRSQMIGTVYSAEDTAEKTVTDQQLVEKIKQIFEEVRVKEKVLDEEMRSKDAQHASADVLKKSLEEIQAFLKTSYCSHSLKSEICKLQELSIDTSVLWVHTPVIAILNGLLSWVEGTELLLQDVGIDASHSDKGLASYIKCLQENHHQTVGRIQTLQAQLDELQESQTSLLQKKLNEQKLEYERELQNKIELIVLEKEEENKKILENAVVAEKDKLKEFLEREKQKVQDMESQLRHLTEVIELKSKEDDIVNSKLRETVDSLEEAGKREAMLKEQLQVRENHLKIIRDENEILKQKLQEEIVEYKEQVRQHSQTIVALEDRLLEATLHQKNIEGQNLALQEKIKALQKDPPIPSSSISQDISDSEEFHSLLLEELAAARKEILSKQAIILGLKKDLSEAKARMSDMIGELSEKQKMELERNLNLVKCQESELNMLRQKLFAMSNLVDKKDKDLKTAAEELRRAKENLKILNATKKKEVKFEKLPQKSVQTNTATVNDVPETKKEPALDLADLGAKCKGLRHEEVIRRQKDALIELRDRIKTLEKTHSAKKVPEALIVLKKDLSEQVTQKIGLEKEHMPTKKEASKPSRYSPNVYSNIAMGRTAKLEMSDAFDSEKMYLDLIHALGSLMNMKELTGVQPVKHLSQDEREKVGLQRQKDLELLYDKISKLKSQLERKELLLKEYESDIEQLRVNKESLQVCQKEMTKLEDEVYREAEENALLKEALGRTQLQLNQEKRLNRAIKLHKPGAKKMSFSEKLKATNHVIEAFKRRAPCDDTS